MTTASQGEKSGEVTDVPTLDGWQSYCEACDGFREAHRCEELDALTGEQYFEFVCKECNSVLLTFERKNRAKRIEDGHGCFEGMIGIAK